jgi:hypothetical protein
MIGPIKLISDTAHPELAEAIGKCLGTDLRRTTVGCAQERALEGATPQGDAPCPRYRKGPIRLY